MRSRKLRCTRWVLATSVLLFACRPDPADDLFARAFIEEIRNNDPGGAAKLQPHAVISDSGWAKIVQNFRPRMPHGKLDSIPLVQWERGEMHAMGPYRKLTYEVHRGDSSSEVQVWLVSEQGQTYVNTLRIVGQ